MGDVRTIERIGGDVVLDFVNTLGGLPHDPDDEYLFSYEDLVLWAESGGLAEPSVATALRAAAARRPSAAEAALARALELRGHVDALLRGLLRGEPPAERDEAALRGAYRTAVDEARLEPTGTGLDWSWSRDRPSLDLPAWILAAAAVDLLRSDALERLSACGHCRWLFLDTSRNRSRRWCSMSSCGSVMKMRRYRAARRP